MGVEKDKGAAEPQETRSMEDKGQLLRQATRAATGGRGQARGHRDFLVVPQLKSAVPSAPDCVGLSLTGQGQDPMPLGS